MAFLTLYLQLLGLDNFRASLLVSWACWRMQWGNQIVCLI